MSVCGLVCVSACVRGWRIVLEDTRTRTDQTRVCSGRVRTVWSSRADTHATRHPNAVSSMTRHVATAEVKGDRAFGLGKGHKTQVLKKNKISRRAGVRCCPRSPSPSLSSHHPPHSFPQPLPFQRAPDHVVMSVFCRSLCLAGCLSGVYLVSM